MKPDHPFMRTETIAHIPAKLKRNRFRMVFPEPYPALSRTQYTVLDPMTKAGAKGQLPMIPGSTMIRRQTRNRPASESGDRIKSVPDGTTNIHDSCPTQELRRHEFHVQSSGRTGLLNLLRDKLIRSAPHYAVEGPRLVVRPPFTTP